MRRTRTEPARIKFRLRGRAPGPKAPKRRVVDLMAPVVGRTVADRNITDEGFMRLDRTQLRHRRRARVDSARQQRRRTHRIRTA